MVGSATVWEMTTYQTAWFKFEPGRLAFYITPRLKSRSGTVTAVIY